MNNASRRRRVLMVMVAVYAVLMADLLFRYLVFRAPASGVRAVSLIPLRTTISFLSTFPQHPGKVIVNLVGNIITFLPLGLYLQTLRPQRPPLRSVVLVMLTSLLVELTQYLFAVGITDIDDVLLNTLGGGLGVGLYRLLARRGDERALRVVTIASLIVGVPFGSLYVCLFIRRVLLQM